MKKWVIGIIALAVLAGGFYIYQRVQAAQAAVGSQYETETAATGQLIGTVGATGIVRANQSATLVWQTTGVVGEIKAEVGQQVAREDVLAQLDPASLPQAIILAQADLVSAQDSLGDLPIQAENAAVKAMQEISTYEAAVRDAQYQLDNFTVPLDQQDLKAVDALDRAKAALDKARAAFEPVKFRSSSDSTRKARKDDLDRAQSDYNSAVRRLELEYRLSVASANLDRASADYQKWRDGPTAADTQAVQARIDAAKASLGNAMIIAPFAGTITAADLKSGDQVTPGTPAFRLDDLSHLLVDVQVSEVDINRIQVGQEVNLTFDAILNKSYKGTVTEVARVGTSTQGVVDFRVTVELKDADENVRPGMTAAVNVIVNQLEDVLLIPNRAVRLVDGNRVVYVLRDNTPTPVQVTLGASSEIQSQVIGGDLKTGDQIVLNPPTTFGPGGGGPMGMR
jgi:HlyD family secretion protein